MTTTRPNQGTVSLEDQSVSRSGGKYLCGLLQCALTDRDPVATGDLADRLGVSRASVTEMVEKFGEGDLVDHQPYQGATLTEDGQTLARSLQWRRCVTEHFLADQLDLEVGPTRAYDIGFEIPREGIDRLATIVDHPCEDICQASDDADCPNLTISSA